MKFFTLYDKPPHVGAAFTLPSLAVQSEKAQCDINAIIARYKKTGNIEHVASGQPLYADCEKAIADLEKARELVERTEDAFWSLSSDVRDQIGTPDNMPAWMSANREAAVKFGFLAPESPAPSAPVAPAETPKPETAANSAA